MIANLPKDMLLLIINNLDKSSKTIFSIIFNKILSGLIIPKIKKCDLIQQIIEDNHFGLLDWAKSWNCEIKIEDFHNYVIAIQNNNFDILGWLKDNKYDLNSIVCSSAAKCGNLTILKWAKTNGCPWSTITCSEAVKRGNFEILKSCL